MSTSIRPAGNGQVMAVVVTYNPDLALLSDVIASVRDQVGRILVFDNASSGTGLRELLVAQGDDRVDAFFSTENVGLGRAINHGFAAAAGYRYILVLDQDSTAAEGMVAHLLQALVESADAAPPVAAVGPAFEDRRTGAVAPFVRIGPFFNRKIFCGPGERVECDFLISSGSLIPLAVIDEVGGMDESLFIDNVDLEWSFRARHRGFRLLGVGDAKMGHAIGDRLHHVSSFGRSLAISLHGPVRLYYMTRNRITLYQRRETPFAWVTQDIPRMLLKFVGMSLFVAPRWRNCRHMLRGGLDALRSRLGPFRP